MTSDNGQPRIAYLTGEYPAVSHTFILREVEALRVRGLDILTCSIRRTDPAHHRGSAEKAAVANTFYVLSAAKNPLRLLGALVGALSSPGRLLSTFALAWRTRPPGLRAAVFQLFYGIEAMVLARHLKKQGIRHLHNHFGNSSCTVAMLTSELSGIPFSYTMHGPAIFFAPEHWRIDEKIARARFIACISHYCRSQGMVFADPVHWSKMHIVRCGVSPARYGNAPARPPGKHILFVGRLAAVKGVPVLLEAFTEVLKSHPDARLTLIGDGPERASIETRAAALGCAQAVRFAGYLSQEEVVTELDGADIFALPSFAEGVPVVLMEAMASRLPVVSTRIAGIPELVEDGISGLIVPPGDAQALAGAISALLENPDRGQKMGAAGRIKVQAEYDISHKAEALQALFHNGAGPGDH